MILDTKKAAESAGYARPDLQHAFVPRGFPYPENECGHWFKWLGGDIICLLPDSDPIHIAERIPPPSPDSQPTPTEGDE
jgi:hypothetical protein